MLRMRKCIAAACCAVGAAGGAVCVTAASAEEACNLDLHNAFGPFDYRTAEASQKVLVESHHFTPKVESLIEGESGTLGSDIDYTLRVFPNHARALMAMSKLARRDGRAAPAGSHYAIECWFQRALEFKPEDAQVHLVYGIDLLKDHHVKDAIEQLQAAESLSSDDPNVQYNLGLAYFDLGDFDQSLTHAHRAYALGFPLPGLHDKLARAGKWQP